MTCRVVSLLRSATEIVCAVGARGSLVGKSHECDFPLSLDDVPVLTRSRLSPIGSSGDIDRNIRAALEQALAVYDVDTQGLARLKPDVIVTQDLCAVCAVSFSDVRDAVDEIAQSKVEIIRLHPERLSDIWVDIEKTGRTLDREPQARTTLKSLVDRVEAVHRRTREVVSGPKVLMVEWMEPVMIGGLWTAELVDIAGGIPLASDTGIKARTLSMNELVRLTPEVILIKPCGFKIAQTLKELEVLFRS